MYEYRNLTPEERQALVEERLERGFPPHQPPHLLAGPGSILLTAACFEHRHHLHTAERREFVLDMLFEQMIVHGVQIHAWVVLTNHYHVLAGIQEARALGEVFRRVHGRTSHDWNAEEGTSGRQVWCRYSDRAIRSERHYFTTLNYMHFNPVRHSMVGSPYEWAWSSVHWYREHKGREWLRDVWVSYPVRE